MLVTVEFNDSDLSNPALISFLQQLSAANTDKDAVMTAPQQALPAAQGTSTFQPATTVPTYQPPGPVTPGPSAPALGQLAQAPTMPANSQPPQSVVPGQVPTAPGPSYTFEQLAVAATQLVDAGRQADVLALLNSFGVASNQGLMGLPKEQYGAFATALRQMGAKL